MGYMGKIIRVNLTAGTAAIEELDQQNAKNFIGGAGMGAKILSDELSPAVDPLGPDNKLLFLTGPLTATKFPTTGRYSIATKSPLTGIWLDGS